jgi:hypothetical protein
LAITSGKAYAYNTVAKAVIDETPATGTDSRAVRKSNKTWDTSTTTSDGTPGETSGTDEPLSSLLVSFMAMFQADELTVMWTTTSENNIQSWNLYRADNDNFATATQITTMPSQGSDNEMNEYRYTDEFDYETDVTYYYWIESVDYSGKVQLFGPTSITINEHENPDAPSVVRYGVRNYPNPFNPETTIEFALKENQGTKATIYIYNIKGQLVKVANQGTIKPDKVYQYNWNGKDMNGREVGSGVYLYKLVTDKKTFTKKMMLLK